MPKFIFVLLISFAFSSGLSAQQTNSVFRVSGNCEMCKSRIEAAVDVKGVKKATWNEESGELKIRYDSTQVSEDKLMKLVANAGHDTPRYKADSDTYRKLNPCCQYRSTKHGK